MISFELVKLRHRRVKQMLLMNGTELLYIVIDSWNGMLKTLRKHNRIAQCDKAYSSLLQESY